MVKGIYNRYGSRSQGPSTFFPEGIFKDETAAGLDNGTPLQRDWAVEIEALMQKIRKEGHVVPNGYLDNVLAGQTWSALLRRMDGNGPPQATPNDICAQMPNVNWADPGAAPNYLNTGSTIKDACIGYDSSSSEHIVWILHEDGSIHNVRHFGKYDSSPTLSGAHTFNWGTTPDEIHAICADSGYLYVAWCTTGSQVYISKFLQTGNEGLFTGDIVYTWGTGIVPESTWSTRMCVANSDYLGFMIQHASNGTYVGSLTKGDPTITSDNFAGYDNTLEGRKIISDGVSLWTIGRDESGWPTYSYALLRANIVAPSTQNTYYISSPTASEPEEFPIGLQRARGLVVMTSAVGQIYAYQSAGGVSQLFENLPLDQFDNALYGISLGVDGKSLYALLVEDDSYGAAGAGYYSVFKLPLDQFLGAARNAVLVPADHRRARINRSANPLVLSTSFMLYDGLDMWLVLHTGEIFRIIDT